MATRSAIGYQTAQGSIKAVYCHWDGAPKHQMPILTEHYNTLDKVKALIAPGSMSSLRTSTVWGSRPVYDENRNPVKNPDGTWMYDPQREPQPLYHYERGDGDQPQTSHSLFYAKRFWRGADCEYLYVFVEGEWRSYNLREVKSCNSL